MSGKNNEVLKNTRYLHEELRKQIEADRLYKLRNDAKIRAVTTAKSYDEFRDIVNAAHLTPLSKSDKINKMEGGTNWNRALH